MYRILIVDDEPMTLEYLSGLLPGFFAEGELELLTAEDGSAAAGLLLESEVDIVITDIRMPEMDGMQLAALIHREYPDTFLLLLSGHEEFAYAQEAIRYGVTDYLLKPIVPAELEEDLRKLRAAVDRRREEHRAYLSVRAGQTGSAMDALGRLAGAASAGGTGSQAVSIGKRYIAAHYNEPLSLTLIAEKAGVTESYLSSIFHKEVGESYIRYLTRIRMENAARLLRETPKRVYEISEAVGYVSVKHFTHTFKQWFGVSPNQYQQQNRRE